jgi:hypothetical protein
MARSHWILPCADSACGKVFHPDRRTAEGHRIALELWNQATGRTREDRRLAVYRCGRCGGYHLASKKIEPKAAQAVASHGPYEAEQDWAKIDLETVAEAWQPVREQAVFD